MRKLNKLAAAIAVALSAGMASQAQAIMTVHHDQEGDAMVFPVYYGVIENYYTIHNNSLNWVQGHVRFRSAAWTAELLDFDIILSPGDVQVIRVADLDGDGNWEVDMNVDPNGFQYVGLWPMGGEAPQCSSELPEATGTSTSASGCMDFKTGLLPVLTTAELKTYPDMATFQSAYGEIGKRTPEMRGVDPRTAYGYIEYVAEAVLLGCNDTLVPDSGEYCDSDMDGVSDFKENGPKLDTFVYPVNSWNWSNPNLLENDLGGVGNYLSGRYYITVPGIAGMSGNALMIRNFRTPTSATVAHRVDNYIDTEVIYHTDNPSALDDVYVYRFNDTLESEELISFNNTWGPTLADGDDYCLTANTPWGAGPVAGAMGVNDAYSNRYTVTTNTVQNVQVNAAAALGVDAFAQVDAVNCVDYWDDIYFDVAFGTGINSIAEVEVAIDRNAQTFTHHFFNGGSNDLSGAAAATAGSWYLAHYPTKFYRGEDAYAGSTDLVHYTKRAGNYLLSHDNSKVYNVEIWDIDENSHCRLSEEREVTSPVVTVEVSGGDCQFTVSQELQLFSIGQLLSTQNNPIVASLAQGQAILSPIHSDFTNVDPDVFRRSFPGVMYTFNITNPLGLDHLVPMVRSEIFVEPPM